MVTQIQQRWPMPVHINQPTSRARQHSRVFFDDSSMSLSARLVSPVGVALLRIASFSAHEPRTVVRRIFVRMPRPHQAVGGHEDREASLAVADVAPLPGVYAEDIPLPSKWCYSRRPLSARWPIESPSSALACLFPLSLGARLAWSSTICSERLRQGIYLSLYVSSECCLADSFALVSSG